MVRASRDAADEAQGPARPGAAAAPRTGSAEIVADPKGDDVSGPKLPVEMNGHADASSNDHDEEAERERPSDPGLAPAAILPSEGAEPVPVRHRASPEDREADRVLVERARDGDHAAFRVLFDKYHKRAFSVAYGVLKNRHDALDVVQEGFVKVHKHLGSFEGTSSFYTWLYRIVMNLAIDSLRRRKTSRPVEYDDAIRRDGEGASEDTIVARMLDANPRKAAIRRELVAKIDAALAELPDYHREVIILREIDGLSYEEMAEILEVPKGTIMSRLFHARKKMQAALAEYVDGDMDIEE